MPIQTQNALGVIGGSGFYSMPGLEVEEERTIETPFGPPSDAYIIGQLEGAPVVFLPRHGRGHTILPGELNLSLIRLPAGNPRSRPLVRPPGYSPASFEAVPYPATPPQ